MSGHVETHGSLSTACARHSRQIEHLGKASLLLFTIKVQDSQAKCTSLFLLAIVARRNVTVGCRGGHTMTPSAHHHSSPLSCRGHLEKVRASRRKGLDVLATHRLQALARRPQASSPAWFAFGTGGTYQWPPDDRSGMKSVLVSSLQLLHHQQLQWQLVLHCAVVCGPCGH